MRKNVTKRDASVLRGRRRQHVHADEARGRRSPRGGVPARGARAVGAAPASNLHRRRLLT